MRRTIRSRPGEVTLLSIGPLTNVALLFATDPEVAGLLKGWVSMAGAFGSRGGRDSEWNSACDPLATSIAFAVEGVEHRHIPLDVTLQCSISAADVRETFKGELLSAVLEMAEVWFENREHIVLHDPLAAMTIFRPDLCEYRRGRVSVEPTTGKTSFVQDETGPDEVALDVDAAAAVQEFLSISTGNDLRTTPAPNILRQ
jgi:purine nucleosidase